MNRLESQQDERIEREFHKEIWDAANHWQTCEAAIAEARQVMYAIKSEATYLPDMAEAWLDRFGRDSLREARTGKAE